MLLPPCPRQEQGYGLTEIMVAMGISALVLLLGTQAYQYFTDQTKVELSKLDDVQQFNLLTKDMLGFSESAGLSTLYFNLPVKIKDCAPDTPCLNTLNDDGSFSGVAEANLPDALRSQTCAQFFRDSFGVPVNKRAYTNSLEMVASFRDYNANLAGRDLYFTWPMKDENSAPFTLLKLRDVSMFLTLAPMQFGREHLFTSGADRFKAVFKTTMPTEQIQKFQGYPFLFYGSKYQGHFGFYAARSVLTCKGQHQACLDAFTQGVYNPATNAPPGTPFALSDFTDDTVVMGLEKINMGGSDSGAGPADFFGDLYARLNLPDDCQYSWGGTQNKAQWLFPSGMLSIFNPVDANKDVNADATGYYNLQLYNKHATIETAASNTDPGKAPYGYLVPVDIIRYSVESAGVTNQHKALVARLWHLTEVKKLTKITHLKSPLYFTRKMGSSEFGIQYNPNAPVAPTAGAHP